MVALSFSILACRSERLHDPSCIRWYMYGFLYSIRTLHSHLVLAQHDLPLDVTISSPSSPSHQFHSLLPFSKPGPSCGRQDRENFSSLFIQRLHIHQRTSLQTASFPKQLPSSQQPSSGAELVEAAKLPHVTMMEEPTAMQKSVLQKSRQDLFRSPLPCVCLPLHPLHHLHRHFPAHSISLLFLLVLNSISSVPIPHSFLPIWTCPRLKTSF